MSDKWGVSDIRLIPMPPPRGRLFHRRVHPPHPPPGPTSPPPPPPATRTCAPSAATATTDQTSPARSPALSLQNELRTANHLLIGSLAGIAAGLGGLRLAGYRINGGLRGISDLETPEAGMMRDQSSIDAASA